jgi:hypothetical protein
MKRIEFNKVKILEASAVEMLKFEVVIVMLLLEIQRKVELWRRSLIKLSDEISMLSLFCIEIMHGFKISELDIRSSNESLEERENDKVLEVASNTNASILSKLAAFFIVIAVFS